MNSSIWHKDGTLTGTTTLGHSGPESNSNERVFYTSQSPRLEPGHLTIWHMKDVEYVFQPAHLFVKLIQEMKCAWY